MPILMQINDKISFETMEAIFDWEENVSKQKRAYKRLVKEFGQQMSQFKKEYNADLALKMVISQKNCYNFTNYHTVTFVKEKEKYIGYFAWHKIEPNPSNPGESVWITHAFLKEPYRHHGIYTQFMEKLPELYDNLYSGKLDTIMCGVLSLNQISLNIHKSSGFEEEYVCLKKKINPIACKITKKVTAEKKENMRQIIKQIIVDKKNHKESYFVL